MSTRTRGLVILAGLVTAMSIMVYAQEPRVFLQPVEVHRGDLRLGVSVDVEWEGATADAYETTMTVTDPTADRTWTLPNVSDTVTGLAATQSLTNKTLGRGTTRITHRQEFDGPCFKAEAADFTAELVTDAATNLAICNGGISNFVYRLV